GFCLGRPPGTSVPGGPSNPGVRTTLQDRGYFRTGALNLGFVSLPVMFGHVQSAIFSFESFTNLLQGSAVTRPFVRHTSWNWPSARISPMMNRFLQWGCCCVS